MSKILSESNIRNVVRSVIKGSLGRPEKVKILVGKAPAFVEVANNNQSRTQGLMYRTSLNIDSGMLFIFEDNQPRSFWMKNTVIPLSIAYADAEGKILNISEMSPMTRGWFKENNIGPGDRIKL
mgnify:CR=1 FL=1